jgi:hypothetical protein
MLAGPVSHNRKDLRDAYYLLFGPLNAPFPVALQEFV